ncbi:MAG: hypothetical protein EHM17_12445 [Verrucomicrobiaceae bacterium]|nr:MAG: hypothetical protein EHM17_12445 [Verrucomicrobiaceae bacterium]
MKHLLLCTLPLLIAASATAATEIAFGPVRAQPGESVRLISASESRDGTIEITKDGRTSNGNIRIVRERDMSWTFRAPEADGTLRGMVSVARIFTSSAVTLDGKEEKSEDASPLNGKMFAMTKTPTGDWKFDLDGSIPRLRIQKEIDELTVYLKRRWYPERIVKVGDSWEFDPAWIRMVIEKDLQNAQTIGTMKLRQVRRTTQKDTAVIDVSVRSTGGDFRPDGSEAKVQLELTGQVMVDLKTMLDERLELSGVIVTSTGKLTDSKKVTLPVNLVVTKSFVKGF